MWNIDNISYRWAQGIILGIVLSSIIVCNSAKGQTFQQDLTTLLNERPPDPIYRLKAEPPPRPFNIQRVSEMKTAFLGAIRLYQGTLSAHDLSSCNFTPSCSRFGEVCLQHTGFVQGVLLTSDRLQRCHGAPDLFRHYPFDLKTGRFYDPVENYLHEAKRD